MATGTGAVALVGRQGAVFTYWGLVGNMRIYLLTYMYIYIYIYIYIGFWVYSLGLIKNGGICYIGII